MTYWGWHFFIILSPPPSLPPSFPGLVNYLMVGPAWWWVHLLFCFTGKKRKAERKGCFCVNRLPPPSSFSSFLFFYAKRDFFDNRPLFRSPSSFLLPLPNGPPNSLSLLFLFARPMLLKGSRKRRRRPSKEKIRQSFRPCGILPLNKPYVKLGKM